jgi:putative ATPase
MSSLFDDEDDDRRGRSSDPPATAAGTPLAERMRPRTLDEIVGQDDILAPGKPLRGAIERDLLQSIILWGPPGTGKTTLARVIAEVTHAHFVPFSAVLAGIKESKRSWPPRRTGAGAWAGGRSSSWTKSIASTRRNRDAFLPRVEGGDIVLIGATTENPSFEVNAALLSRSKVFVLKALPAEAVESLLRRALTDKEHGLGTLGHQRHRRERSRPSPDSPTATRVRRSTCSSLQPVQHRWIPRRWSSTRARAARSIDSTTGAALRQGRRGALQPHLRSAQVDAEQRPRRGGLLGRAHARGRRGSAVRRETLIRFASEDIGNADPQALTVAVAAKDAAHFIGMPEGNTALAQAAIYLATAPKSNAVYTAYNAAAADAHTQAAEPVPLHLVTRRPS